MKIIDTIKGWFTNDTQKDGQASPPVEEVKTVEIAEVADTNEQLLSDEVVESTEEKDFLDALNNLITLEEIEPPPTQPPPQVSTITLCQIGMNTFWTEWVKPERELTPRSWREENAKAAIKLLEEYGDALSLFFTGTVESQVMLLAFVDAGKIPRVYTINFQNDQNISPQTSILVKYYQQLDFKMRVVDVDSIAFWTNMALEYTGSLGIISSNEALRRWGSTSAAGVPVLAGAFPHLQKFDDRWYMADHEQYFIVDKMVQDEGMQVISSFVKYSAEQLSSYITDSTKRADKAGKTSTFDIRSFAQEAYPEFEIVERELTDEELEFEKHARQRELGRISICWHEIRS